MQSLILVVSIFTVHRQCLADCEIAEGLCESRELAGRASEFCLPGKLAELAYRPSREIVVSLLNHHRAGGVDLANTGDQREVSGLSRVFRPEH
jgi:hypothetical protein